VGGDTELLEIPAIGSGMDKLSKSLEQIVGELSMTMKGIERLTNSEETKQTLSSLNGAMVQISELTAKVNEQAEPTLTGVQDLMKDARGLVRRVDDKIDPLAAGATEFFESSDKLVRDVDGEVESLATSLKEVADAATKTLQRGDRLIAGLQGLAPRDSALAFGITNALRSMTQAMDSIRDLASYLEQHPEALLSGKSGN
jgi:paraquat-inducible protein B